MSTVAAKPRRWTVDKPTFPSQNLPYSFELRIAGIVPNAHSCRTQSAFSMLTPAAALQSNPRDAEMHRLRS